MNHLIGEIKQRGRGNKQFKVFSDEEIYELPTDLKHPKEYNSDYKLEDDEWFHVPEFSKSKYCIEILTKGFISTEYDQINKSQLEKLKFLCSYQQHEG